MSKRVEYVDECKGLLIILVVLGHVVQELTLEGTNHPLFNCIYAFHMPCFMFLAGYLAYITFSASNMKELAIGIADKTTTILLPYFTWPILIHGLAFKNEWNWEIWGKIWDLTFGWSPWWFLKYVFLYYLIYAIILGIRNMVRLKTNMFLDCAVYLSSLVGFLILRSVIPSLDTYILHGIFFFIGVIFAKHEPLRRLAMNKHVVFIAISIFLMSVFKYDFDDRGFENKLIKIAVSLSTIPMFFSGFTSIQGDSIVRSALGRYGRGSLAIYVAHFSILGLISNEPLQMDSLLLLILSFALSIVIIEFCFLIKILCGVSSHMKFLLYGGKISVLFGNRRLPKRVTPL